MLECKITLFGDIKNKKSYEAQDDFDKTNKQKKH